MDSSDLPVLFGECIELDFENLLKSPARLGSFLSLHKLVTEMEEQVRHAAIALAMREIPIPGWTLVRKNGHAYVEAGTVLDLLQCCPIKRLTALLPAISSALGNMSEKHYTDLCEAAGIAPDPDVIKHPGATVFLRQNSNKKE
jgi:hypothetical protein